MGLLAEEQASGSYALASFLTDEADCQSGWMVWIKKIVVDFP
jgi:hypothetical protein